MDTRRFMLYGALALVLLMLWDSWVAYSTPAKPTALKSTTEITAANNSATSVGSVGSGVVQNSSDQNNSEVPQAPDAPTSSSTVQQSTATTDVVQVPGAGSGIPGNPGNPGGSGSLKPELPTAKRITVITDLLDVEIDSMGGDIRRVELLKLPVSVDKPDQPFVLMTDTGKDLFVAQSGLAVNGSRKLPNHNTLFTVEKTQYRLSAGKDEVTAWLNWQGPDGVRYRKYFRFRRNSYIVDVGFEVDNRSTQAWQGNFYAQLVHSKPQKKSGTSSFFTTRVPSYQGAAIYTPKDKFEKVKFNNMEKSNLQRDATGGWVSMIQHYFTSAWLPGEGGEHRIYSRYQPRPQGARYYIGYTDKVPVKIAAGQKGNLHSRLYVGPKDQDRLSKAAEGLVLSVDYGWLTPVSNPLFW
ncbi:MAG TPA: YidC/Oxa1 family membrane protein insertase, partial [Gammaproteobacteria bacterium]|nr:YidC/Oxa1 family membrane protein insertase [Gammaproteobacteria bacterium]